jgi:hypothetical protein
MEQKIANKYFSTVGDGSGLAQTDDLYKEELQLAMRNRGMPLEALRYPITPTGLHYLLVHYDIPEVNVEKWRLKIARLVARSIELTRDEIKNGRAEPSPSPWNAPVMVERCSRRAA